MTAFFDRIRTNLTAKIVLLVGVSEVLLLAVAGGYYLRSYNQELQDRIAEKLSVPAALMSEMALNFDVVTDLRALEGIVQEKVIEAFVARRTGDVFFASDPAKIGRPAAEFVEGSAAPGAAGAGRLRRSGTGGVSHLSLLVPLRSGGREIGQLFLKVDAAGLSARVRRALLLYVAGSALAVLLTMVVTGFWVQRLLAPRIGRTVAVLEEVRAGGYSARVGSAGDPDQIGQLMRSVDAMIDRIEAHTADLQALARAGRVIAAAESRADIQRALAAAVEGRFRAVPAGTCSLRQGADPGLPEPRRAMVAAGELLMVAPPPGQPGPVRLLVPVVDPPETRAAVSYAIDPAAVGREGGTDYFLRTLGGLVMDAVLRVDALARLREAEKEYRDLFSHAAEGIFKISGDGRLLTANPALARMLGYGSPAELIERFADPPGSRWERVEDREEYLRRVRDEGEVQDFETRIMRRDGSTLWVSLSGRAVRDAAGGFAGVEGSVADLTERKRREAAEVERKAAEVAQRETATLLEILERQNRQLEQTFRDLQSAQTKLVRTEKMAAMGTMAAGVAHDLNNILSGIVGYPDLLLADLPAASPLREIVEAVKESGVRAAAVVADLLTLARGAAYVLEECDLNRLVAGYLQSPEHQVLAARHPGVRVATELQADLRPVRCSRVHLQKVIMNLVMNAFEALGAAGRVTITTRDRTVAAGDDDGAGVPPGAWVALEVEDTGPGIAQTDLAHVFEPFFTKKVLGRSGTGLGLAVVWNTVQEHGGTVVARSGATGASFTVLLPAAAGSVAGPPEEAPSGASLRGSGRVLVVDDERHLRDLTARMLTALGYTVETASSGEEALAVLRERPADLVLLDMLMPPGMSGIETYRQIARLRPGQKAVICSGFSQSADVVEAQLLGAGVFLQKPFGLAELGLAVREELAGGTPPGTA